MTEFRGTLVINENNQGNYLPGNPSFDSYERILPPPDGGGLEPRQGERLNGVEVYGTTEDGNDIKLRIVSGPSIRPGAIPDTRVSVVVSDENTGAVLSHYNVYGHGITQPSTSPVEDIMRLRNVVPFLERSGIDPSQLRNRGDGADLEENGYTAPEPGM